jgi:hypothetical protein
VTDQQASSHNGRSPNDRRCAGENAEPGEHNGEGGPAFNCKRHGSLDFRDGRVVG